MPLTPSTMLPLGTEAPDFALTDVVGGGPVTREGFRGRPAVLVMFICNHCPYVVHVRPELVRAAHEFLDRGVGVVAINSNSAATHPQDGPENMRKLALDEGWRFPFAFDGTQAVAKAFRAACTPDLFVLGPDLRVAYRGQFDDSRPGNGKPLTGRDLRAALDAILAGRPAPEPQSPSMGCNIKWAPGNEPDYAR
jgi:peroxiredoxin